jgi:MFS family permease
MHGKTSGLKSLLSREFVAIMLMSAAGFFSQALLSPVLSLYMRDVGLTDQNIGLLVSAMMVGIAIGDISWGWAVDRMSIKIVLILGAMVYGITTTTLLIPRSLPLFLVVMVIYGISRSSIFIVGRWYMGVNAPEDIKAQAFAILTVMISITESIAGFSSGFFVEAWGFHYTIWIAAAVPFIAGLLVIIVGRWLHFKKPEPVQGLSEEGAGESVPSLRSARATTFFLGSIGLILFVSMGVVLAYLPLFASDVVHLAPSQIGILFGLRGIIMALSVIPLSRLADRTGKPAFILMGIAVVTLSMIVVVISRDYTMLLLSVFLFAIGTGMCFPSIAAILAESVPITWVGTATGIYGVLEDVGWMIGPAVGGLLLNYGGLQSPFVFGAITASVGIPLFLWGRRKMPATAKM